MLNRQDADVIEKIREQNRLTPVEQAARYETVNQVLLDATSTYGVRDGVDHALLVSQ